MLRAVMASPGISAIDLAVQLEAEQKDVKRNLAAMEQEGLLHQKNGGYMV